MTKLIDGKIPAKSVCGYATVCEVAQKQQCRHTGEKHAVDYSCAIARAFAIVDEYQNNG